MDLLRAAQLAHQRFELPDKLRLDLMYIENYSILLDIKLILMTLRVMLKKESTEGFDSVIGDEEINRVIQDAAQHDDTDAKAS